MPSCLEFERFYAWLEDEWEIVERGTLPDGKMNVVARFTAWGA
jgi:hypothetical protein